MCHWELVANKKSNTISLTFVDLNADSRTGQIVIYSTQAQKAGLAIIDVSERAFLSSDIILQKGNNTSTKGTPSWSKGIHYVTLFTLVNQRKKVRLPMINKQGG